MSTVAPHSAKLRETDACPPHWSEAGAVAILTVLFVAISNLAAMLTGGEADLGEGG